MQRLTAQILEHATRQPEGMPIAAKSLLLLGNRAALDQALSRHRHLILSGSASRQFPTKSLAAPNKPLEPRSTTIRTRSRELAQEILCRRHASEA